jgi:hypothetical protein
MAALPPSMILCFIQSEGALRRYCRLGWLAAMNGRAN